MRSVNDVDAIVAAGRSDTDEVLHPVPGPGEKDRIAAART
jgi:hypothetical protein